MKSLRTKALIVTMALATALAVGLVSSYASSSRGKVTKASEALKPGANTIPGWKIKNASIQQWKLAPFTLGHGRIGNDAIQANNIAHGAVGTAQIADGAVGTAEIADGSVTASKLDSSFLGSLFVVDPASTQTVVYGGGNVGTILQMASGATADPLEIQDSNGNDVFAVGPDGSFMSDAGAIWSDGLGDLNVSGAFSTDGGTIWTDGVGDLTVQGSFSTDGGSITSDGSGDLTVQGDLTSGGTFYADGSTDGYGNAAVLDGGGLAIDAPNYAGNFIDAGFGTFTVDQFGNLTTLGSFSSDNGSIYSDGLGNLTVEGSFNSDGGAISSDGNGNLWVNDLHIGGTLYCNNCVDLSSVSSLDLTGHLTVGDYFTVSGDTNLTTLETSGLATLDSLAVTNDASVGGNLTVTGSISSDGGNIYSDGVNGDLTVNTLTANDVSTGTLESTALATLDSLQVTYGSQLSGDLNVGNYFTVSASDGSIWADGGAVATDGAGDLVISGSFSSDGGNFATNGNGDLVSVGSITAAGSLFTSSSSGTDLSINGNFTVDGSNGAFSADAGSISSDGNGNLTIDGAFSSDGGAFTTDGSGNISAVGSIASSGDFSTTSTDSNALVVGHNNCGGGTTDCFTVNGNDGSFSADNGAIYSDGAGNLTVNGLTVSGVFNVTGGLILSGGLTADSVQTQSLRVVQVSTFVSNPQAVANNAVLSDTNMLTDRIITVAAANSTLTTDNATNIIAAMPSPVVGDTFSFVVVNNDATHTEGITGGAGVTFALGTDIAPNDSRVIYCRVDDMASISPGPPTHQDRVSCY